MPKTADVADEQATAWGEAVEGLGQHVAGVVGRREVLHHRVQDDRVERSVDATEIMGGAVMQRDGRAEARGLDLPAHARDDRAGEIGRDVAVDFGGDSEQQQARAGADLEDAAWAESQDRFDGRVEPGLHLDERNRVAGDAAVPATEVLAGVAGRRARGTGRRRARASSRAGPTRRRTRCRRNPRPERCTRRAGAPRRLGERRPRPPRRRRGPRATASISPGSTRKPRTLSWRSRRPRNWSTPFDAHWTRSPLRYMRPPGSVAYGLGTKRSAVVRASPR